MRGRHALLCLGLAALCLNRLVQELLRQQSTHAAVRHPRRAFGSHAALVIFSPLLGRKCGADDECLRKERNAVSSWALLERCIAPTPLHILAFLEQEQNCDPAVASTPRVVCIGVPQCVHSETGIPTVNCVAHEAFAHMAATTGHADHVYLLVNSDIIFTATMGTAFCALTAAFGANFVMVGRRVDTPLHNLRESQPEEMVRIADTVQHVSGYNHSVFGLDYFMFPQAAFPSNFPSFLFGRFRWDNVLALELLSSGLPVIDASDSVACIHPGYTENASNPNHILRLGATINTALAKAHSADAHLLGRIDNAPWRLAGACPACVVLPQQPKVGWGMLAYQRADRSTRSLTVLCVCNLAAVESAVKWTERAAKLGFEHYMLIAFEDNVHQSLRTHNVTGVAFAPSKEPRDAAHEVHQDCSLRRNDIIQQLLRFGIATHVISDDAFTWTSSVLSPLTPDCDVAVLASDTPNSSFAALVSVRPTDGGRAFWGVFRRCVMNAPTEANICRCLRQGLSRTQRACLTTDGGEPYILDAARWASCNSAASDGG
jgi:hypothetical protein